jgi:hypothetical protein
MVVINKLYYLFQLSVYIMYELDNLLHERNENLKIQIYESPGYVYEYNFLSINIKTDNKIISFEASII